MAPGSAARRALSFMGVIAAIALVVVCVFSSRGGWREACASRLPHHRPRQRTPGKLLQRHRLAEQKTLHEVEAELVGGDEVGAALDAFGHGARAVGVRELDDV